MPARPMLPADDLYARLELPAGAALEAVRGAWRALLKQHHPDVVGGGADADERAKRINVAHDWLSDPDLRARYDRERHPRRVGSTPSSRGPGVPRSGGGPPRASAERPLRRRPVDAEDALARHL